MPNYTTFLSWDCGTRALAYSYVTINLDLLVDIENLLEGKNFDTISEKFKYLCDNNDKKRKLCEIVHSFLRVRAIGIFDLIGETNKPDELHLSKSLKEILTSSCFSEKNIEKNTIVLIEEQPTKFSGKFASHTNKSAKIIENQLMFYYSDFNPILTKAWLKNKISLNEEHTIENIKISMEKLRAEKKTRKAVSKLSKYCINKKHTKENFKCFVDLFNLKKHIELINKKDYDDAADSLFQIFGYIKYVHRN